MVGVSNEETKIPRPSSVIAVAALVMFEALAVLAYVVNYAFHLTSDGVVNIGGRLFMLALCLFLAIWQGSVAINFFRGRAYTRAPIIVWQLFQLILSVSFFQSDMPIVISAAVLSIIVAGTTVVLLFAPKTTQFLGDRPSQ